LVVIRRSKAVLSPQPWSWPGPRVLIEHPDVTAGLALASSLRQAGFAVAICPGPEQADRCPLTGPEGCGAAHGADVVVSSLGLERPQARAVVESLRRRCPGVSLIVEVAAGQEDSWHDLLEGCQIVSAPATPEQLVSAVQQALARNRREQ
jgi:DNA-binding response OmpR family regulator